MSTTPKNETTPPEPSSGSFCNDQKAPFWLPCKCLFTPITAVATQQHSQQAPYYIIILEKFVLLANYSLNPLASLVSWVLF